jgi:broad specificity phosphatase PhoE
LEVTTNVGLSITLVRHGESTWNELGLIQGHDNTAQLTAQGRNQARWAAESLRGLGFQALVASDLDRAQETAAIIGAVLGLESTTDPLLRERGFGVLEGHPLAELTPSITGIDHRVMVNPDASAPEGESFREVVARVQLFVKRLLDERPEQRVLVVSHGGTIRALRASVTGEPVEGSPWYAVGNCSVWPLDVRNTDRH